ASSPPVCCSMSVRTAISSWPATRSSSIESGGETTKARRHEDSHEALVIMVRGGVAEGAEIIRRFSAAYALYVPFLEKECTAKMAVVLGGVSTWGARALRKMNHQDEPPRPQRNTKAVPHVVARASLPVPAFIEE